MRLHNAEMRSRFSEIGIRAQGFGQGVVLDVGVYFGGVRVGGEEFAEGVVVCGGVGEGCKGGDGGGGCEEEAEGCEGDGEGGEGYEAAETGGWEVGLGGYRVEWVLVWLRGYNECLGGCVDLFARYITAIAEYKEVTGGSA